MGTFDALRAHVWAYPALEAMHILGIALLVGNLVALEVRVLGRSSELPLPALARLSLSLALAGFGIAAASGLLMFSTQPAELLANRSFQIKMGLLAAAGLNALWFHRRGSLRRLDLTARLQVLASSGLWVAAVVCGRWIAY
ncbi:MAG: hypothetical protein EOO24_38205 [Comamonadaceae bacterium]|nr:MAG: hypothetical protein EOO24_38205 [Comamonadaceae bacterium]